jgi:exodeoxyribonuclease VII small subunit
MAEKNVNTEMTFESAMVRLEQIVNQLESGKATLDDSLCLYEEGIALVRLCSDRLDKAEQKIKIVKKDTSGELTEEDFNA